MTMKELIQAEIDNLGEEELKEIYGLVKKFTQSKPKTHELSLMAGLRNIEIDAPEDFATNFDLYVSGERRVQ